MLFTLKSSILFSMLVKKRRLKSFRLFTLLRNFLSFHQLANDFFFYSNTSLSVPILCASSNFRVVPRFIIRSYGNSFWRYTCIHEIKNCFGKVIAGFISSQKYSQNLNILWWLIPKMFHFCFCYSVRFVISGNLLQMVDSLFCYTLLTHSHSHINLDTVAYRYYYFVAVKLSSG